MPHISVELTDAQAVALEHLARESGLSEEELVHRAVERLLGPSQDQDWKSVWLAAAGMWSDRPELDDLVAELRHHRERRLATKGR